MKISYILVIVIAAIVINFLISSPNYNYDKPQIDNVRRAGRLNYPEFFIDFPSEFDRIRSYEENLYGDFAR